MRRLPNSTTARCVVGGLLEYRLASLSLQSPLKAAIPATANDTFLALPACVPARCRFAKPTGRQLGHPSMPSVALVVLRSIFVMVAVGMGVALINSNTLPPDPAWIPFAVIATCLAVSGSVIALDVILGRKRVETMSAVYFGLVVGLFLTYVVRVALTPLLPRNPESVH